MQRPASCTREAISIAVIVAPPAEEDEDIGGGEGGIRTLGPPQEGQRFSRPPRSTAPAPLRLSAVNPLNTAPARTAREQARSWRPRCKYRPPIADRAAELKRGLETSPWVNRVSGLTLPTVTGVDAAFVAGTWSCAPVIGLAVSALVGLFGARISVKPPPQNPCPTEAAHT